LPTASTCFCYSPFRPSASSIIAAQVRARPRVRPSRGTQRLARPTARVDPELGGGKEGGERRRAGDGTVGGLADLPAGEKADAADAARQKAAKLDVDLFQVEGCGARGRITVKEVVSAANRE